MAFDTKLKMSFQDADGNYLTATLNADATYTIGTSAAKVYLPELPQGWDSSSITWERDNSYMGVFRSGSQDTSFKFSGAARAIINAANIARGLQAFITLKIWVINFSATELKYDLFYPSQLDFKTYRDNVQDELVDIGLLDGGLIRDIHAYGDTAFNIPIWQNINTDLDPVWVTDSKWILHDGIKLLYNASYTSGANKDKPFFYLGILGTGIAGFNHGADGDGYHVIPSMAQYNIVQNNGTTTFIGNDILLPDLIQGDQTPGAGNIGSESTFYGTNHSQPYTKNNFSIKDLLPNNAAAPTFLDVSVAATITMIARGGNITGTDPFLALALFEIDETDSPHRESYPSGRFQINMDSAGLYSRDNIFKIPYSTITIGTQQTFGNYDNPITVRLNYNKVYVMCIIYDNTEGVGSSAVVDLEILDLKFSILSKYDNGRSGMPIPAPALNPSVFAGFRLHQVLEKLVPYLATTRTNAYGFPIPVTTPYTGASNFLSNPALPPVADCVPYQIMLTSAYCIHDLQGQSYITLSLHQLFDFCKKVLGCGAGIEYDADGNPTTFRIEEIGYFFDDTVEMLDLGFDIEGMEVTNLMYGLGSNLKLGYAKADTNSDFGVDAFNTELYFNTPLSNTPGTMDYQETSILTEQYAIEKIRAQKVKQPIGEGYNPANPSGDNIAVALYCQPSSTVVLPNSSAGSPYDFQPYDPSNTPVPSSAYQLTQRNGTPVFGSGFIFSPCAQNSDPAATSQPYISGLYYPDSAINVELSPCRALQRGTGRLLHSVLDLLDDEYLSFRNTSIMQYNNAPLDLAGTASNLNIGSGAAGVVNEFSDKPISGLPAKLFKPRILKVRSKYPVNTYRIINSNPNGYITWKTKKGYNVKTYKGFLVKAVQNAGNNAPTDFYVWATTDTVI